MISLTVSMYTFRLYVIYVTNFIFNKTFMYYERQSTLGDFVKDFEGCNHIYAVVGYDGEYVRLACIHCGNVIVEYCYL